MRGGCHASYEDLVAWFASVMKLSEYEIEYVGGPFAGQMTHFGVNEFINGEWIEVQPPLDAKGHALIPHSVYRYKNGAFYWRDPSKKPPLTLECPTCKGRGVVKA